MPMQGTIIRAVAGFYYVYSKGTVYECRARGIFRKDGITPLVGDEVEMTVVAEPGQQPSASTPKMGVAAVDRILPRLNSFTRPPAANVELLVLVASVRHPAPSFLMLDRVTVTARKKGAELILCVNKTDLAEEEQLAELAEYYKNACVTHFISVKEEKGVEALKAALKGKKAALAGPSGAGKSSLANLLLGEQKSITGDISRKLQRGRNTTRHTELFAGDGFFLFDTPGFTSFEDQELASADVADLMPDIAPYAHSCRFSDCRHLAEPGCAVRQAVAAARISPGRYASYVQIYKDALAAENKY